jgi:hypothetical protein
MPNPVAVFETSMGEFSAEIFADKVCAFMRFPVAEQSTES